MRLIVWSAFIAVMSFVIGPWGAGAWAQEAPKCRLVRAAHLDMTPNRAMQPSIPVVINGVQKSFFIDTAGIFSAVTEKTVQDLGLKTVRNNVRALYSAYGKDSTLTAYPETFQVGMVPISRIGLVMFPPGVLSQGFDSAGSVAGDILHLFDTEYDFGHNKFSLFMPNDCGEGVVHWPYTVYGVLPFDSGDLSGVVGNYIVEKKDSWHIVVPGKLDGVEVNVTIDTGSTASFLTLDDAKTVVPRDKRDQILRKNPDSPDDNAIYAYPFHTLELGAITVRTPWVIIRPNKLSALQELGKLKPDLVLGMSALRNLHMYVSYKDRKVYVTAALLPNEGQAAENPVPPPAVKQDVPPKENPVKKRH